MKYISEEKKEEYFGRKVPQLAAFAVEWADQMEKVIASGKQLDEIEAAGAIDHCLSSCADNPTRINQAKKMLVNAWVHGHLLESMDLSF